MPRRAAYLGRLVLGGGDEVGAVGRPLQVGHLHAVLVGESVGDELAGLDRKSVSSCNRGRREKYR